MSTVVQRVRQNRAGQILKTDATYLKCLNEITMNIWEVKKFASCSHIQFDKCWHLYFVLVSKCIRIFILVRSSSHNLTPHPYLLEYLVNYNSLVCFYSIWCALVLVNVSAYDELNKLQDILFKILWSTRCCSCWADMLLLFFQLRNHSDSTLKTPLSHCQVVNILNIILTGGLQVISFFETMFDRIN